MKSLFIALAMYSKLPAPGVEWDKKSLSWALCWFPVIGVVIGALLYGWFLLCAALGIGPFLRRADRVVRVFCGLPSPLKGELPWN